MTVEAYEQLTADGIRARVVSMPSMELFDKQPPSYREEVLPPAVTARVSVEKGTPFGWDRWVGSTGTIIGMSTFGASAPMKVLQAKFGYHRQHRLGRPRAARVGARRRSGRDAGGVEPVGTIARRRRPSPTRRPAARVPLLRFKRAT